MKANSTMTIEFLPRIKRLRPDPFSAGQRAYQSGDPFDPDFGRRFAGWGTITAQCLYEAGRLAAAGATVDSPREKVAQKRLRRLWRVASCAGRDEGNHECGEASEHHRGG